MVPFLLDIIWVLPFFCIGKSIDPIWHLFQKNNFHFGMSRFPWHMHPCWQLGAQLSVFIWNSIKNSQYPNMDRNGLCSQATFDETDFFQLGKALALEHEKILVTIRYLFFWFGHSFCREIQRFMQEMHISLVALLWKQKHSAIFGDVQNLRNTQ